MEKTTHINLDSFLALYTRCQNEDQKQRALASAWLVLTLPGQQTEAWLGLKQIADYYQIDPSTAWRWCLPSRDWRGLKRYLVSECDQYIASDAFKQRRAELKRKRKADRKSGGRTK